MRNGLPQVWTRLAAFMAALAVVMLVLIPPGFMPGDDPAGPSLVICTGHGRVVVDESTIPQPDKPQKHAPDGACPFAGHGGFGPTATATHLKSAPVRYNEVRPQYGDDNRPGLGLAAPPPQSRAPPFLSA